MMESCGSCNGVNENWFFLMWGIFPSKRLPIFRERVGRFCMKECRFMYTVVLTVALRNIIIIIWGLQTGGEGGPDVQRFPMSVELQQS